jgi:hypothetical protein
MWMGAGGLILAVVLQDSSEEHLFGAVLAWRSAAKPTRSEKVEVGLMFDFNDGEKPQMYPLRYIEDFSPSLKLKSNPRTACAAGRDFAGLPQRMCCAQTERKP